MPIEQWLSLNAFAVLISAPILAQGTTLVSIGMGGTPANSTSQATSISHDGRFVAFESWATNLVPGDRNWCLDIFVRDRLLGRTERVSLTTNGRQADRESSSPFLSGDGRFVAFQSMATNLVGGHDGDGFLDVYVRDRRNGTTERVSVDSNGQQGDGDSFVCGISANGRYVVFFSWASNLVPGDTNGTVDVFVRDRTSGRTELVSVATDGTPGDLASSLSTISPDGRFVVFWSRATDFTQMAQNGMGEIYVRDRWNRTTEIASVDSAGMPGGSDVFSCSISADGRFVAFDSYATNLVSGDSNGAQDCFVHDRLNGTTERVSVSTTGVQGNGRSNSVSISADGRYVSFTSWASNLVPGDTNGYADAFLRDRQRGTTERLSLNTGGVPANTGGGGGLISADGRYITFMSDATNLVPENLTPFTNVFLRDRVGCADFTSTCDPGQDGVIACPCSNPPDGPHRGCDNSAATGGASLFAAGIAYLSIDSLVFTTSRELPTATSFVLQGAWPIPAGYGFGQGVRCLVGSLHVLYTKSASGGSITAPDFGSGDPTVSARSAASGDVIQPGQSRCYLVYYRDPIVLGGCPATDTFNATATGRVDWSL
jgi:Tol biopolymer transport system component